MFEKLIWQKDRMLLNDLVFRLEHYENQDWELGENCFRFYKIKQLVDQYDKYWHNKGKFNNVQNIFELGLWDGGSVAFWFEHFQPKKHVSIDLKQREDSRYFSKYINSRGLNNRIKTYWNTNQADSLRLKEIVQHEFANEPLDLVIDDASHLYKPTKVSFETLFPLLCPGGIYIIEDWAWWHWKGFEKTFSGQIPLSQLIFELVEATGSSTSLIGSISIYQGFIAVERGINDEIEKNNFRLENYIYRHPKRLENRTKPKLRNIKNWIRGKI